MNYLIIILVLLFTSCISLKAEVLTIDQCVEKALANYPLVKKYDLLASTFDIALSDINKGWLPRIGLSGQVTMQNTVPSFPDALAGVLAQMGQSPDGLGKVQYKVGVDVSQNIWDGGVSRARREIQRSETTSAQNMLDVEMYAIRQRVENIYFAILLTEEHIKLNNNTVSLINANLDRMRVMFQNGIAMQSDVDMLEAQALTMEQTICLAKGSVDGYRTILGIFMGEDIQACDLALPEATIPPNPESNRPELKLYDSKIASVKASKRLSDTSPLPKFGLFAQAYYGYPGFDYFKSMMNHNLSFNIMVGVRATWNIDAFYTRANNNRRYTIEADKISTERDVFLFNTEIQSSSSKKNIAGLRNVMAKDRQIVLLRRNVRETAESQLRNGIIDATALLTKINDENQAELTATFHEIQLIQEIYNLKYILNR